jgi:hypothetical protein
MVFAGNWKLLERCFGSRFNAFTLLVSYVLRGGVCFQDVKSFLRVDVFFVTSRERGVRIATTSHPKAYKQRKD